MDAPELVQLWAARDEQYIRQANRHKDRRELTDAEQAAVRDNRRREIDLLKAPERAAAWNVLQQWVAPVMRGY